MTTSGWLAAAAAACLLLVGCGAKNDVTVVTPSSTTTTTTRADAIAGWRERAAPAVDQMGDALGRLDGAAQGGDFAAMSSACRELGKGVENLEQQLPSPDPELTGAVQGAVERFSEVTRICVDVGPEMSQDQIDAMKGSMQTGAANLTTAIRLMEESQR